MQVLPLKLPGTYEIRPVIHGDSRGYFSETYLMHVFKDAGLTTDWVQDNRAMSSKLHTLRGFHYQVDSFAQTKLVSCAAGRILDVFVDIREGSGTFGRWDSVVLDADKCNSVYVPRGFAHAYCTLTVTAIVHYKVDNLYSRENERGIRWNDPDLGVAWPTDSPVLSERDKTLPRFREIR